jgi:hypothetical protein
VAVPTHRRILAATLTVLSFWATVFGVYSWFAYPKTAFDLEHLLLVPERFLWVLAVVLLAASMLLFWETAEVFAITLGLRPRSRRGASTTTLGMLPRPGYLPKWQPLRGRKRLERLRDVLSQVGNDPRLDTAAILRLAKSSSARAELFWTVFEILDQSGLPASPFRGSHGDSSLVAHSLRVSAALAKIWATTVSGTQVSTRVDQPASSRSFDLETAILAGLTHDLGKVQCFRRQKNGNIEVIGLHDIEGSRLLARLDAFWELYDDKGRHDDATQRLLTQAIRYYHHPYAYPASGTKRAFVQQDGAVVDLMQAIRQADLVAGSIEGREAEILADYQDSNELPEQDLAQQVWESFQYLLSESTLINHKSPERRIGYKQGNALYLAEKRLRALVCDHLSITRSDYLGSNNGNPGKIIQIIASRLDAEGLLKKQFQDRICNKPEGAGFYLRIEGATKDGEAREVEEKIPYYVVKIPDDGFLSRYRELDDYRSRITLYAPTWPQYFGKKGEDESQPAEQDAHKVPAEAPEMAQERSEAARPADDQAQDADGQGEAAETTDEDAGGQSSPWDVEETSGASEENEDTGQPGSTVASTVESETRSASASRQTAQASQGASGNGRKRSGSWSEAERAERQRKLQSLAKRAEQSHAHQYINRRILLSPEEQFEQVRTRVRHLLDKYPDILSVIPGRSGMQITDALRKRILFSLLWMDQEQRDRRRMAAQTSQVYRGSLADLLTENAPKDVRNLILETMQALGSGHLAVLEIHMLLDLRLDDDGTIDPVASTLIAPVKDALDAQAKAG